MSEIRLPDMPTEDVCDVASMGEGLVLKNRKTVNLTADYAAEFLDYPEFIVNDQKVDRPRSDNHVIYLARAMQGGSFLWEQVNFVLCEMEGNSKPTRLNGNHTSWARLVADSEGFDPKINCPIQLLRYKAETIEDMRRLYASLDRGRPRSQSVVIGSYLAGTEDFPDTPRPILRLLSQGIGQWLWPESSRRKIHGGDDRAYLLLKDHHKVALAVANFLKGSGMREQQHLTRAPVVAAMFETFNKAPQIALEFWKDVRDGLGIHDKEDPRRVLRDWLMLNSLNRSRNNGDIKVVASEAMYRASIYKFNDHRAGKKAKNVKIDLTVARPQAK